MATVSERDYFDHAAGAPLVEVARAAVDAVWRLPGNPSSLHTAGRSARRLLEESRETLAGCLGAHPTEIVFTSGGTEANNLAMLGASSRPGRPSSLPTGSSSTRRRVPPSPLSNGSVQVNSSSLWAPSPPLG